MFIYSWRDCGRVFYPFCHTRFFLFLVSTFLLIEFSLTVSISILGINVST